MENNRRMNKKLNKQNFIDVFKSKANVNFKTEEIHLCYY